MVFSQRHLCLLVVAWLLFVAAVGAEDYEPWSQWRTAFDLGDECLLVPRLPQDVHGTATCCKADLERLDPAVQATPTGADETEELPGQKIIQAAMKRALKKQDPEQPSIAPNVEQSSPSGATSLASNELSAVFSASQAGVVRQLSAFRRAAGSGTGSDFVLGLESNVLSSSDTGDLLSRSNAVLGVTAEHRTPIVTYNVARGKQVGQQAGSGSYWFPARQDLDTMLSKLDSRIIDNVLVIKGPYAARFGPAFAFYDVQLKAAPRYAGGYESHLVSVLEWNHNGDQWYGRETVVGGAENWGFRVGYGDRSGSDYHTGLDRGPFELAEMPTSYHSRDWDLALGWDPSPMSHVDFTYLRLDQSDVEFPGQIFDFDFLVTDAFELNYVHDCPSFCDRLELEGWYNRTRFHGNAQGAGKRRQIPALSDFITLGINLDLFTDVDASSAGYVFAATWGDQDKLQLTCGTDLRYLKQALNEYAFPSFLLTPENSPIPPAYSANPGIFLELSFPAFSCLTVSAGGRADWVHTNAYPFVDRDMDGVSDDLEAELEAPFDQSFDLGSGYLTAERSLGSHWELSASAGYAMRPPTITELYAVNPFVAVFPQFVFTAVRGNPELEPERMWQTDVGLDATYENVRAGARGFHAWIDDYITYVRTLNVFAAVNESLALVRGGEAYAEVDWTPRVTTFVTAWFVQGENQFRDEPLVSIPPLDSRCGLRIQGPSEHLPWGVEFSARVVDDQDQTARSLLEVPTPGFTTFDLRAFAQLSPNLLWTLGVENLFDRFYQEHLDPHGVQRFVQMNPVGFENVGVFQPGVNLYSGIVWEF
ncbi:MAG: TonB-dependent receptor [Pirellulaceae bacterium]|nr:TonB-dependent receptor [Pirellulaceae bacterium]